MEQVALYGHAIASVVVYAVIAQILNAATGIRKGAKSMAPGSSHEASYDDPSYRLDRTYMNTIEMMPFYIALVFAAILVGANPFWTNVFAAVGMIFRVLANIVYLRGFGKGYGGLRTQLIIGISLCNLGLAVLTMVAIF